MKKLRTFLVAQAVITFLIGLYLLSTQFPDERVSLTGNPIAPIPNAPEENPVTKTFGLFALFGILLAIGAVIELVILAISAFR
jgi:hypothetical protein